MAMQKAQHDREFEELSASLTDDSVRSEYERLGAGYRASLVPTFFGLFLIACGNLIYGREPSYLKFRAIEVIARVPYHSWESAAYTLLTLFYSDEEKAVRLTEGARFSRLAQDNETMHVVVISGFVRKHKRGVRYGIVPVLFAWFYFWASYAMYLMRPKWSYELNYLFEDHAYHQYSRFIEREREHLKVSPVDSEFLRRYGRNPRSQLEFFCQVRNDELIHRNQSLHRIDNLRG